MAVAKAYSLESVKASVRSKVAASVLAIASPGVLETMEILLDQDQNAMLFASLRDVQEGKVVSMGNAFADLD